MEATHYCPCCSDYGNAERCAQCNVRAYEIGYTDPPTAISDTIFAAVFAGIEYEAHDPIDGEAGYIAVRGISREAFTSLLDRCAIMNVEVLAQHPRAYYDYATDWYPKDH